MSERIEDLPEVLSLEQASRALGICRSVGYRLARNGKYPVPVYPGNCSPSWYGKYKVDRDDVIEYLARG